MIFKKIHYNIISFFFKNKLKKHGKKIKIYGKGLFENLENVTIGNDFSSLSGLWLATYNNYLEYEYNPQIIIGNNVHFSRNCHVGCINKITICDDVLIGNNVLINDHSHGVNNDFSKPRNMLPLVSKGEIFIGNNTWICDNVVIVSNVKIGNNCIVAANSFVNKSFEEDGVLIAGNPAKIIKKIKED